MKRINFGAMEKFIRAKLKNELPATLSYHGSHHTDDVYAALVHLCGLEGVSQHDGLLLRTAALYHDCGFTVSAKDHEKISCDIARETLPSFGYPDSDIEKICGMIMATKIPQSPKTKLEEILCDADLDYLGRDDYEKISSTLFDEIVRDRELSQKDWLNIQINFLKQHHFFTASSIDLRKTAKDERLRTLEKKLAELK